MKKSTLKRLIPGLFENINTEISDILNTQKPNHEKETKVLELINSKVDTMYLFLEKPLKPITRNQACFKLRCIPETLSKYVESGLITPIKTKKSKLRFSQYDIEELIGIINNNL